ncbi:Importin subunit alpha [Fasciola hepatica]|uniref:Importin subunit alpha n=1 Tax=Fasciola hepatica TaxID=6192 RepID=A0A4E0RKN2_FASHE|nr:Importin subunit alpha [Fasciola hepatica]
MERSRLYKNQDKNAEELRRRRVDQSVELRRAKKDEQLQKRRNILLSELDETSPLREKQVQTPEHVNYDSLIREMRSSDDNIRFRAIQLCRKTLSRAKNPPIDEFYNRGAVDILVEAIDSKSDSLVFEATWALTNIASGDSKHTMAVAETGAIPKFVMLLSHSAINVAEQSVWALGNIAGDGARCRDLVIGAGVLNPLFKLLERVWDMPSVVSNIAWVLSNLCRNRDPTPPHNIIKAMLPVFKRLLQYDRSKEVVVDTAWALAYASDAANNAIDDILGSGCLPLLLRLLSSNSPNLVSPALRAVGNLVIGDDAQTQAVIDAGLLPYVPALLNYEKSSIVKETCWMVSNLTAGSVDQIQAVIDHNLVPNILEIMHKGEFRTQKEACWVINNMVNGGSAEQCAYLLNQRVIPALANLLTASEAKVIIMVLEIIKRLFEISEQYGHLESACIELETCGGVDKMEQLQDHGNDQVYKTAYDLIDLYFNDAEPDSKNGEDTDQVSNTQPKSGPELEEEFHFDAPESKPGQSNFDF